MKKSIGEQVYEFRTHRAWTTLEMAKAIGTSRQSIESLEAAGSRMPRYIDRLAKVMGATVEELIDGMYSFDHDNPLHTAPVSAYKPIGDISPLATALAALFDQVHDQHEREIAYREASAAILKVIKDHADGGR